MTRLTKFSDAFWDADFCGTNGFDSLCRRMKDARQICREFDDFIKARAKIEDEYAKSLQRLAKTHCGNAEIGTLKHAFDTIKSQTEHMAEEHSQAHQAMMDASRRLNEFMEQQKNKRKVEEQTVSKSNKKKSDLYRQTMTAKKNYEQKCRDADHMDVQVNLAKGSGASSLGGKEWEKLYAKQTKTRNDAVKAETTYKNLVDSLEQTRQQWEKEMINMCNAFQQLETERIQWLRNEMWAHVNIISQTCVDDDNHCEEVRKSLEQCDVDADLEHFITERKTGLDRPAPIPYEPYQGQDSRSRSHGTQRPPQPPPGHRPADHHLYSSATDQEKTFL